MRRPEWPAADMQARFNDVWQWRGHLSLFNLEKANNQQTFKKMSFTEIGMLVCKTFINRHFCLKIPFPISKDLCRHMSQLSNIVKYRLHVLCPAFKLASKIVQVSKIFIFLNTIPFYLYRSSVITFKPQKSRNTWIILLLCPRKQSIKVNLEK